MPEMYYVSIDTSGRVAWESNELFYGVTKAHIIEVLTEKAGNDYKAFLRKLGISYVIVGEDKMDHELVMDKLKNLFGIEMLIKKRHNPA